MLEVLHKAVFIMMFLIFFYGNYIIVYKLFQFRNLNTEDFLDRLEHSKKLKSGLWYLDFAATVSPIVGLLGTILALIMAFNQLSQKGVSGASEISAAIGTALWATAIGIAMSLWFYFFFKLFSSKVSVYKEEAKHHIIRQLYGGQS